MSESRILAVHLEPVKDSGGEAKDFDGLDRPVFKALAGFCARHRKKIFADADFPLEAQASPCDTVNDDEG